MKNPIILLLALCACLGTASAQSGTPSAEQPPLCGSLEPIGEHKALHLWGTPKERGFAHGYLLGEIIVDSFSRDLRNLLVSDARIERYSDQLLPIVIPRFRFSADELAELQGILDGINKRLPRKEDRTLKTLGRPISLEDLMAINTVGDWMALGCASVVFSPKQTTDGFPAVARNFDFPAFELLLDHQIVMVCQPSQEERGHVGITFPGCIGVITGMNSEGVFASIHDVRLKPSVMTAMRRNIPRLLVMRRLLQQLDSEGAVAAASERLSKWSTLYGNNLLIATPKPGSQGSYAGVFEYDFRSKISDGVTLRGPDGGKSPLYLACTNHHRLRELPGGGKKLKNCWRYRVLTEMSEGTDDNAKLNVDQLFDWVETISFPRRRGVVKPMGQATLHQVVALTGKKELHVRFAKEGSNIQDIEPRVISLSKELDKHAQPREAATSATDPGK